jgi:hypothetical protein
MRARRSVAKLACALLATLYAAHYAATYAAWHFIDYVDLVIHEAGHTIFSFFGEFAHVLMGSGFQILFPAVFVAYFFSKRAWYSGGIALFWVGINILNVSLYMSDAVRMQLPLIGGHHDWNWLFTELGVLPDTAGIAGAVHTAGILVLIAAASLALVSATRDSA